MFLKIILLCNLLLLCIVVKTYGSQIPEQKVKVCPLEKSCGKVNESSAICAWDEEGGCIRKFASKCHLDIAACHRGESYSDFNDIYCQMETYICEETPTYERWTIFFGNEKD